MDKRLWSVLALALLGVLVAIRWLDKTHPTGFEPRPEPVLDSGATAAGPSPLEGPPHGDGGAQRSEAEGSSRQGVRSDAPEDIDSVSAPATPTGQRFLAFDARTETPLIGFRVSVTSSDPRAEPFTGQTSSTGSFRAPMPLPQGIVDVEHLPDPGHGEFMVPWKCTVDSLLVDAFDPDATPRVLRFIPPSHCVRILVVGSDGTPRPGCPVTLTQGAPDELDIVRWRHWYDETTDEAGIAHVYLHGDILEDTFAAVVDHPHLGELSDALTLEPPLRTTPYTIRTYPGAFVDIEVLASETAMVEGVQTWSSPLDSRHRRRWEPRITDENGMARLGPLAAGSHRIQARRLPDRRIQASQTVELHPNEVAELTFDLGQTQEAQVAVSGRVLDRAGQPVGDVALAVRMDNGIPEMVFTNDAGEFAWVTPRSGQWVTVDSGASLFDAPMDPERLRVPPGTTDVEFRIEDSRPDGVVIFSLVDDISGEWIPDELDPAIVLYREPADRGRILARAFFGPDDGVTEVDFAPHDDLYWVVHVPGYQEARGRIDPPVEGAPTPRIEVRMHRGFRREFLVRNASTAAPLSGVSILTVEGTVLATTDREGRATVTGSAWPERLRFDRTGHVSHMWSSEGYWGEFDGVIWLEPDSDPSMTPR